MSARRHRRGFERVGPGSLGRSDLPKRRERELRLAQAWRAVAGEAVARRAVPVRIARGVLEVEIADVRWARALAPMLGSLAGRLAASHPDLGVRKLRVRTPGDEDAPAVPVVASGRPPARDRPGDADPPESPGETSGTRPDIRALAERYLRRTGR